jgi:methylglutamate dehydrogenase subunit D
MPDAVILQPRSAFADLLSPVGPIDRPGVMVSERRGLQIATVIARGDPQALAARTRSAYGIDLTSGPRLSRGNRIALVGTGPRTWLALRDRDGPLAQELESTFADAASIVDQSDRYAVLRLSGSKVRATFEKGLGVDLHPRAFRPGDAATTACAHIGVILWQLDDTPTYEIAVFRSLASAFWHWLSTSAAEYGLGVAPQR